MMTSTEKISPTAQSLLQEAQNFLASRGIEHARMEAEILLAHVLDVRREDFLLKDERTVTATEERRVRELLDRRGRREPLAYLVATREFWSLDFKVNAQVLIPRPETEGIIEELKRRAGAFPPQPLMLDMGTGSGILAVVAAKEIPGGQVTAVELSPGALEVARENAQRHGVADRIRFMPMDMMKPWKFSGKELFDGILCNPPYIPEGELDRLMPEVRDYEPRAALLGGPDGLEAYRSIALNAARYLKPGGILIMEMGYGQSDSVRRILEEAGGFESITIIQDLSGHPRVVSARRALG
ncbi:MAG: peptide chain release factor N(5)-glutamine methyltransferase [Nitrospinaceae bacterium]|nr:peptide chain release factor N(5)-glutamine methyltransferase [Nitrospinaceae bacterium]NIR53368.1 peptide chain release factor N(5)-glutamine methyltransferase [Nitrospinaceae bacterium]NIS83772.1 peptide chain release factor N(5)-glutamine methyltransferase [Nitrospinaceae bacterium]NIT80571.1 peptide chain release factor N(5)-glutamine methyltransferase [Nitrospinaceae bacterium]NIU42892.1 peptide chain release factor N(5)-glutamine methyltransferase [Nitrospinaceae bacterium]